MDWVQGWGGGGGLGGKHEPRCRGGSEEGLRRGWTWIDLVDEGRRAPLSAAPAAAAASHFPIWHHTCGRHTARFEKSIFSCPPRYNTPPPPPGPSASCSPDGPAPRPPSHVLAALLADGTPVPPPHSFPPLPRRHCPPQFRLISRTRVLVALFGSALHHCRVLPPPALVVEIQGALKFDVGPSDIYLYGRVCAPMGHRWVAVPVQDALPTKLIGMHRSGAWAAQWG